MRILVIEAEHKIANALKRGLENDEFSVDVAFDGKEGLTQATSKQYDLIIVDQVLPSPHNGREIVGKIRQAKIHTPVLLLTDKTASRNKAASTGADADDYLAKPFAFSELLRKVHVLIGHPKQTADNKLIYKDLVLDPATYTVTRGKTPIELTHREFTLLEYMMRNPGRILTKDMITRHVWDYDADILPNTVEVYMGYIRNKIEKPFGKENLIRTRRGFGYIFGEA